MKIHGVFAAVAALLLALLAFASATNPGFKVTLTARGK
jgi:hypothetical protein